MKFRLTYAGELRATQRDPVGEQPNPLAAHKHEIRREFHRQLKQLWATNKFLRDTKLDWKPRVSRPIADEKSYWSEMNPQPGPMAEVLADRYHEFGYRFVPLVRDEISLLCSLSILFLRRDIPGSALSAGDIDTRIKTVIDALRRPRHANELAYHATPAADENPFFRLLEDDSQVSHLEVETDTLLDPPTDDKLDDSRARLVVTVELRPYYATLFNLSFC